MSAFIHKFLSLLKHRGLNNSRHTSWYTDNIFFALVFVGISLSSGFAGCPVENVGSGILLVAEDLIKRCIDKWLSELRLVSEAIKVGANLSVTVPLNIHIKYDANCFSLSFVNNILLCCGINIVS
jgi:hypothetical protein